MSNTDTFTLGGKTFSSRFILGSGKYSLELIKAAIERAGAEIVTVAIRRANPGGVDNILDYIEIIVYSDICCSSADIAVDKGEVA